MLVDRTLTKKDDDYELRQGSGKDRGLLVKFLTLTYQEIFPEQKKFNHLAQTVEQYLGYDTPLWWTIYQGETIGGLWMGNAIDQVTGERYAHIFLLYINPDHRRLGLGTILLQTAENWAKERGDRQLGLQVFNIDQPAVQLYEKFGFQSKAMIMNKLLV